MHFIQLLLPLVSVTSALAAPIPQAKANHDHTIEARLPGTWYQPRDHPVHSLFSRSPLVRREEEYDVDAEGEDSEDSEDSEFPEIGTDEWSEGFPTDTPDANDIPAAWKKALDKAVKAGKIPKIPQTTQDQNATPSITYPKGTDPMDPKVCSSSYQCRHDGSLWDAPDGYWGTSFDDGPTPATTTLLDFLEDNEEKATLFMIGSNILKNPDIFKAAFDAGHDIAVHTWTHRAMTTLSNSDIVAEIGWTMELIRNSTGGRVPRFWRPPYGDSDTRVQAIAHEVFGLRTVIWNQDTDDWNMATGQKTKQEVTDTMAGFIDLPKSPGLVVLEHDSAEETVQTFIAAYPKLIDAGWKLLPVTQLYDGLLPYQNVNSDEVTSKGIIHEDTDAGDDLKAPVAPSAKTKDNGGVATLAWSKSAGLLFALFGAMFFL